MSEKVGYSIDFFNNYCFLPFATGCHLGKPSLAYFGNLVRGKIGSIVNSSVLELNLVFLLPLAAII